MAEGTGILGTLNEEEGDENPGYVSHIPVVFEDVLAGGVVADVGGLDGKAYSGEVGKGRTKHGG